jgi:hypothetical protein
MKKYISIITTWIEKRGGFPAYSLLLLLVMFTAYKIQVGRLGIYYDDWEGIFLYKQGFSAQQIWEYFLVDRPFSSLVHILFNPIFGASTIGWHLLGLLLNWGAILLLVKMILYLWPSRTMEAGWIGLLMGVYPAMQRQFVVHTSAPHYVSMFLFCLSLYLMVKATEEGRYRYVFLTFSVLLAGLQVLIIEYFTALELIRPFVLFLVFKKQQKKNIQAIRSALVLYLPYLLIFAGFVYYKFNVIPSIQINEKGLKHQIELFTLLKTDPVTTVFHYLQLAVQDMLHAVFFTWTIPIDLQDINLQSKLYWGTWIAGFALAIISVFVLKGWQQKTESKAQDNMDIKLTILLALTAMILGGLPAWIINRQAIVGIWSDRFLFGQMFGAVPLIVLIIIGLTGQERRRAQSIVFAILLAGAISQQIRLGNKYAFTWNLERSYFWQLKWRVPSLEEDAFILSPYTPFDRNSAYQIAYAVNVMYAPANGKEQVPVWWFDGPSTVMNKSTGQYVPGEVNVDFRSLKFRSELKRAVPVMFRDGRGCLVVLDPIYESAPIVNPAERQLFPLYNTGLIKLTEDKPMPTDVFGAEPAHEWCYYFQKADLARSFGQWDEVIDLWKEITQYGYQARYGPEYLPFIEAFAQQVDWDTAAQITLQAQKTTKDMEPLLCLNWERIQQNTPDTPEKESAEELIKTTLVCQP